MTKLNKYIDAWNQVVSAQSKISIHLSGIGLSQKDQKALAPIQRKAFDALTELELMLNDMLEKEKTKGK